MNPVAVSRGGLEPHARELTARQAAAAEDPADPIGDEGRRHLVQVRWNAQRMGRLIADFLAFSPGELPRAVGDAELQVRGATLAISLPAEEE